MHMARLVGMESGSTSLTPRPRWGAPLQVLTPALDTDLSLPEVNFLRHAVSISAFLVE